MGTFVVLDGPQGAVLVTPTAPQEAENDGVSIRYLYTGKEISFLPNDRPGVTGKTTLVQPRLDRNRQELFGCRAGRRALGGERRRAERDEEGAVHRPRCAALPPSLSWPSIEAVSVAQMTAGSESGTTRGTICVPVERRASTRRQSHGRARPGHPILGQMDSLRRRSPISKQRGEKNLPADRRRPRLGRFSTQN